MPASDDSIEAEVGGQIKSMSSRPEELRDYLDKVIPFLRGPEVLDFSPRKAYPGSVIEIKGRNFARARDDNSVTVGGRPAMVVTASRDKLKAITDLDALSGPVVVKVGDRSSRAPFDFVARERPESPEADGPPVIFSGCSLAVEPGHMPPLGLMKVLFVLTRPNDCAPRDEDRGRKAIIRVRDEIHEYYRQASYGKLDVSIDVTSRWHGLTGTLSDYADLKNEDIICSALDRLMAESARVAMDEGFNLNDYAALACVINLNGRFVRARGGWSGQNFSYGKIRITADHELNLMAISESANWGRFAHEIGHGIVSRPGRLSGPAQAMILSEDVYSSDLIDRSVATAQDFDLMGRHDIHPLFSAYYMDRLGWYSSQNVLEIRWGRSLFCGEFYVVAHGLEENQEIGRYHLLRIRVSDGLFYYVEVRQRPGKTGQIFDEDLPMGGAHIHGGVVVTRVLAGAMNMNQQTRFITLLHLPRVLTTGEVAADPARFIRITVVDGEVEASPLVCRVRVEWKQYDDEDPAGRFDLRIEPWDNNWQSPDIWIDRIPYGVYDEPLDVEGRPMGNGDKPRPMEINHIWARIRCDGTEDARDVRVSFYAVEPPGIGDNGNWGPLETRLLQRVPADGHVDTYINWVPVVESHTCIKVWIEPKPGEICAQNNDSKENVLHFESSEGSSHEPVAAPVAIRNPLQKRTIALIGISHVPEGYTVQLPHRWVWLEPWQERRMEVIIIPGRSEGKSGEIGRACIRLEGYLPHDNHGHSRRHSSRMMQMGGVTLKVCPKLRAEVGLAVDGELSSQSVLAFSGQITPPMDGERLRVDLFDPEERLRAAEAITDSHGRFRASFDLLVEPSLDMNEEKKACTLVHGIYRARALVIDSRMAVECESNQVCVSR